MQTAEWTVRATGTALAYLSSCAAIALGVGLGLSSVEGTAADLAWPLAGLLGALGGVGAAAIRHGAARAAGAAERTLEAQGRKLRQLANSEAESATDRDRLSVYLDAVPIGCFICGDDGVLLYVNGMMASWLGRDGATIVRDHTLLDDIFAGGNLEAIYAAEQSEVPLTIAVDGGEPLGVVVSSRSARTASGQDIIVGMVQCDAPLAGSPGHRVGGARYVQLFDDAPIGIVMVDPEGRIVETNGAFRRLAGEAPENLVGVLFANLVAIDDRPQLIKRIAGANDDTGAHLPLEVRLDGEIETIASIYTSGLKTSDGKIDGLILHVIDTTEQKNLEMQFAQSQKMQAIGQLAGGVAHDFNNLLTAMMGFCDLLLMRHRAGDQSFSDIMQIKQNANRAASLVRQLLAFSRRQTLQAKIVDLTDILSELSHLLRRLIGESIELEMSHGRDLGPITADPGQIEQVIINLAVNARDAMPEGGKLTIRTRNAHHGAQVVQGQEIMAQGDYVAIEVGDTGRGIPKKIMGKIFEPFFSTKEVGAGTGLGLSTVYGIVKQTGGYIFVDSDVGRGTVFTIYLPRHMVAEGQVKETAAIPREVPTDLTGKGTILLVEDEDVVRAFAARALRGKGYTVVEAEGGKTAIEIVRAAETPIDLVVTDVVMPHMNGPALVAEIRRMRPGLKVIFISGYAEDAFRGGIDALENVAFLPKPFSLKQLATKVKETMQGIAA